MPNKPPAGTHVTYSRQYRRCHKLNCARCCPGKPGHGPYWFAYWREDRRVHSQYLGSTMPDVDGATVAVAGSGADAWCGAQAWLQVRSLGRFQVTCGTAPVPAAAWGRRPVRTLFTCLLSARDHRLHREQLIDALWPEATLLEATRELHRAMYALRSIVDRLGQEPSALRHEGEMIVLEPGGGPDLAPAWLDADVFAQAATVALQGRDVAPCRAVLALYTGDYLPDDPYSEWVAVRRAELQAQYVALLLHQASLSGSSGDLDEAEQCLRAVLRQDACHEDAAATLMGILASAGRRIEALRVYQALAAALETTMDLAPNGDIERLRARLQAHAAAPLVATLPPKGSLPASVGNLPAPLTSFVGRAWEQREILSMLQDNRLVTLTGPGGCGKTRLALEAAGRLDARYPDGIWLVELAGLMDPTLLPRVVADIVGTANDTQGLAGSALVEALRACLRPRRLLLLLDNCEHLLGASAELATALLGSCAGLTILATSREALGIAGETAWRVQPLAAPADDSEPVSVLLSYEAVRLFVDRARASCPSFTLRQTNAPAVLAICRRLDGLPLALELAAARLGTMSVETVAARLHDCFALLTGGNRTALPRQQTLRATMDWSYGLLGPRERAAWRRLAVFADGWTLEAAEAVCMDDGSDHAAGGMAELLGELANRSLVSITDQHDAPRYHLLETMRQYAGDQLAVSGETDRTDARHRRWYLDQLMLAGAAARTEERGLWLDRLEQDFANLRLALTLSGQGAEEAEAVLLCAEPIAQLCLVRGHMEEGKQWLLAALAATGSAPVARAMALNAAGTLASAQGEYEQAVALYQESNWVYMRLGDRHGAARVLINHGIAKKYQGESNQARVLCEAGCGLAREHGDAILLAVALNNLGVLAIERGDTLTATAVLEESLALKRQSSSQTGVIQVLANLGEVARAGGDLPRAVKRYEEALALAAAQGDRLNSALLQYNLGLVAAAQGANARAAAAFHASLRQERELGNQQQVAANLEGLAGIAISLATPDRAGRLLGAAEGLRERIGAPLPLTDLAARQQALARVGEALGSVIAATARSRGRAMALEEAVAEALVVGLEHSAPLLPDS